MESMSMSVSEEANRLQGRMVSLANCFGFEVWVRYPVLAIMPFCNCCRSKAWMLWRQEPCTSTGTLIMAAATTNGMKWHWMSEIRALLIWFLSLHLMHCSPLLLLGPAAYEQTEPCPFSTSSWQETSDLQIQRYQAPTVPHQRLFWAEF